MNLASDLVSRAAPSVDPKQFRAALGNYPTGVAVVTTVHDGVPLGLTCNSFTSVSLDPPLVLWSLRKESRLLEAFSQAKRFAVNLLADHHGTLSNRFANPRIVDKFDGLDYALGELGVPLLDDCIARFECVNYAEHDGGDHVIFIGRVLHFDTGVDTAAPLVFCKGSYRSLVDSV